MQRLAVSLTFVASLFASAAQAAGPIPVTRDGALPFNNENNLSSSFKCIGQLIDKSDAPTILLVLRNFDDGTVPVGQNGPLNDRGYLSALNSFANLNTHKIIVTIEGEDYKRALASLDPKLKLPQVTLDASFTAYDQRTIDKSKSADLFLFNIVQGLGAVDKSYSAIHFTGVLTQNGIAVAGGGFRHKAVLVNTGSRYSISVFSDDNDLGATFARSSFQAVGDVEEQLIDLGTITTVEKIFRVDVSQCLNQPGGADDWSVSDAVFTRMSTQERNDATIASLFQLGYLAHPSLDFTPAASQALRRFQSRHDLPPDGLPNAPTLGALGRAIQGREGLTTGVDAIDRQLGRALENGRTGATVTWNQSGMTGFVVVGQTWDNYRSTKRPCRAFTHTVEIDHRRLTQPERIACRLARDVWAPLS